VSPYGIVDTTVVLLVGVYISLFCWLKSTFQLKVANLHQGLFRLMFTHSKHGREDYLVSASLYGEIMIWTVCPIKGLECIWQVKHKIAGFQFVIMS